MKKGLILSLMMAVVALSVPTFAVGPTIGDLPSVIVGDNEGAQASPARRLMLYLNAVDLSAVITQNDGLPQSALKVYYADDGSTLIKPSTESRLVDPLTAGEISALTGSGTLPIDDKQITSELGGSGSSASDFYWLSLVNVGCNPSVTSAYTATAAAEGTDPSAGSYTSSLGAEVLTLYAADTEDASTTPALIKSDDMVVYSVASVDDGYSGAGEVIYSASGNALGDNWVINALSEAGSMSTDGSGNLVITASTTQPTTPGERRLHFWQSGTAGVVGPAVEGVTEALDAGKCYRMRFSLSASGVASADLSPRYRMVYLSERNHHLGGVVFRSNLTGSDNTDLDNLPYDANPKTPSVVWTAPFDTTEMADGEIMSDPSSLDAALVGVGDVRDYILEWSIIDPNAADGGVLTLSEVIVEEFDRPASTPAVVGWGTSHTLIASPEAFDNAASKPWAGTNPDPSRTDGAFTRSAASFTITAGDHSEGSLMNANPQHAQAGVPLAEGEMARCTWILSSSNPDRSPVCNVSLTLAKGAGFDNSNRLRADLFGSVGLRSAGSLKSYMTAGVDTPPCSPKTTGSTIEVYLYANELAASSVFIPQIATPFKPNRYGGDNANATTLATGFGTESAIFTVTNVIIETMAAPF